MANVYFRGYILREISYALTIAHSVLTPHPSIFKANPPAVVFQRSARSCLTFRANGALALSTLSLSHITQTRLRFPCFLFISILAVCLQFTLIRVISNKRVRVTHSVEQGIHFVHRSNLRERNLVLTRGTRKFDEFP